MPAARGELIEIWLEHGSSAPKAAGGRVACPAALRPRPGQYLVAAPAEPVGHAPLPVILFPGLGPLTAEEGVGQTADGRHTVDVAPPLPAGWVPGTRLELRGPLGNGFRLGAGSGAPVRRLALAALGDTAARLLPLARTVLAADGAVTLFSDLPLPHGLPPAVEAYPLEALAESLAWADFLALDLPLACLPQLRGVLGLAAGQRAPVAAQALVLRGPAAMEMPCAGVAECGVCAVHTRHGWKLACKDGPVFDLNELEW